MPHFDVVKEQKQKLREALLKNQKIVNLLMNTGNNMVEFEDFKTGSKSPASTRIKSHFYIPKTTTRDMNFITMRSRIICSDSDVVKETAIVVYVICNEDQIDLLQGSRADLLADEIDKIANTGGSPLFGLGGIKLSNAEEVQFNDGYTGWQIPYFTHERNQDGERL